MINICILPLFDVIMLIFYTGLNGGIWDMFDLGQTLAHIISAKLWQQAIKCVTEKLLSYKYVGRAKGEPYDHFSENAILIPSTYKLVL
jgi:hypothetical protein